MERIRRKPGRPKSVRPTRVMVSVPGDLAPAVKEMVRVYRQAQPEYGYHPKPNPPIDEQP